MDHHGLQLEKLIKTIQLLDKTISNQALLQKDVLSLTEACSYMGISSSTLYKLTAKQSIRHFKPNGKKIFFQRSDIDKWILTSSNKVSEEEVELAKNSMRDFLKTI